MNYGNERFTQYLASNNCTFALLNFSDKSSVQGADMSRFICRYSAYVQEKAIAYRSLAYDFCKIKRGSEDAVLRTMPPEKLLKALPVLIAQFDSLLSFDARGNELSNAVISAAFALLYRDATRLFIAFNDGIINLLSKYFESMSKKQCRESLEIYKKFIARSERLSEFSKVAEYIGIERADITRLEKHPASFLEAMASHLAHLEGRPRPAGVQQAASTVPAPAVPKSGSSSSLAAASAAPKLSQVLLEEQQQLDRLKAEQMKRKTVAAAATPPAAVSVSAAPSMDDFLIMSGPTPPPARSVQQQQQQLQGPPSTSVASPFVANFPALNTTPQNSNGFDPFGSVLQPVSVGADKGSAPGDLNAAPAASAGAAASKLTGDLDSSLASLVGNLNMRQGANKQASAINWGVGGSSSASSTSMASSSTSGPIGAGRTAGGVGVKISAGPTVNWGQQASYPVTSAYGPQSMSFLHTQSQPAFRMSPLQMQQQQQQQQAGWYQANNVTNSNDPFGAL